MRKASRYEAPFFAHLGGWGFRAFCLVSPNAESGANQSDHLSGDVIPEQQRKRHEPFLNKVVFFDIDDTVWT